MSEINPIEENTPVVPVATTPAEAKPPSNININEASNDVPAQNPKNIETQKKPELTTPPTTPEIIPEKIENKVEEKVVLSGGPAPESVTPIPATNNEAIQADSTTKKEMENQEKSEAKRIENLWNNTENKSPFAMNAELMNFLKEGDPSTSE